MFRIYARWVVAMMAYEKIRWKFSVMQIVGKPMCPPVNISICTDTEETAIPISIFSSSPNPATVMTGFFNAIPKFLLRIFPSEFLKEFPSANVVTKRMSRHFGLAKYTESGFPAVGTSSLYSHGFSKFV